jgi:hypothetical protein
LRNDRDLHGPSSGSNKFPAGWYLDYVVGAAESSLQGRNQFIEWAIAIESALLVASITLVPTKTPAVAWAISAFALLVLGQFFLFAVRCQNAWRKSTIVREHVVYWRIQSSEAVGTPKEQIEASKKHLMDVIDEVELRNRSIETPNGVRLAVLKLGFGLLFVATAAELLWFSYASWLEGTWWPHLTGCGFGCGFPQDLIPVAPLLLLALLLLEGGIVLSDRNLGVQADFVVAAKKIANSRATRVRQPIRAGGKNQPTPSASAAGMKPYVCPICDRQSTNSWILRPPGRAQGARGQGS